MTWQERYAGQQDTIFLKKVEIQERHWVEVEVAFTVVLLSLGLW